MPAPDLQTLLDFESQIEDAMLSFLREELTLPDDQIYRGGEQDDMVTPRVEVMFETGEAQDPPVQRSTTFTTLTYREFAGSIVVRIISDAAQANTIATHRALRGQVRASYLIEAANFDPTNLPYLDVKYMRPTGTTREVDEDLFVSELTWDVRFAIRNDAWPSS